MKNTFFAIFFFMVTIAFAILAADAERIIVSLVYIILSVMSIFLSVYFIFGKWGGK